MKTFEKRNIKHELFAWIIVVLFFLGLSLVFIPVAKGNTPEKNPEVKSILIENPENLPLVLLPEIEIKSRLLNLSPPEKEMKILSSEKIYFPPMERKEFLIFRKDLEKLPVIFKRGR